jgi:hypothetical protein
VEVSRSGDLGYTRGTYVLTATDPASKKVVTEKGQFITIFRKEAADRGKLSSKSTTPKLRRRVNSVLRRRFVSGSGGIVQDKSEVCATRILCFTHEHRTKFRISLSLTA